MQELEKANHRNSILINESSADFIRTTGRNFIMSNDTYLTFNPNFNPPGDETNFRRMLGRENINNQFFEISNSRQFNSVFDNNIQEG